MAALSFFFPVAGWILWGVKKDTDPEMASNCAKWAWIGCAVGVVSSILLAGL